MGEVNLPKTCYYELIKKISSANPEKPAVINSDDRLITYRGILNAYESISSFFLHSDIKPYSRITVSCSDELDMSLFLVPIIDYAVFVPLVKDLPLPECEMRYKLMKADYLITDDPDNRYREIADKLGMGVIIFSCSYENDNIEFSFEIINKPKAKIAFRNEKTGHYFKIVTTSGTTGVPKIVPTEVKTIIEVIKRRAEYFEFSINDYLLITVSIFKSHAFNPFVMTLISGGTVVLMNGFDIKRFFNIMDKYPITSFTLSPAVLSSIASYMKKNDIRFKNSSLRFIRASGAPLQKKLKEYLEEAIGAPVVQSYGMSETYNIACTYADRENYVEGSTGKSTGLDIKISDGEICVKGFSVFRGYENKDIDNGMFFTDGWFHTGDLGYIDEQGNVFVTGRVKEMINRGGEKISPYEVEDKIMLHPHIADTAVFPYPNGIGSEDAGAVIVLESGKDITLPELRKFLSNKISGYKMPTQLYKVDIIPKSDNNKVQRNKLWDILSKLYPDSVEKLGDGGKSGDKLSKTEKTVMKIWQKTLGNKRIGPEESFLDIGGDSLNGSILLGEIEDVTGVRIPVDLLFSHGTIRKVSSYIDGENERWNRFKYLTPVKASGNKKPVICVHPPEGDSTTYNQIGRYIEKERPVLAIRFNRKNGEWLHPVDFDQMAERYIKEIVEYDSKGPYYLLGFCYGGVLAFRMGVMMKEMGHEVRMIMMLDSASKTNTKKKPLERFHIIRQLFARTRDAIEQNRKLPSGKRFMHVMNKARKVIPRIDSFIMTRIYWYAANRNNRFLLKVTRGHGALGYSYNLYKPEHYSGRVNYVKALVRARPNQNEKYWEQFADEYELLEMDCKHHDIIIGEHSKTFVKYLMKVLEEADA